VRAAPNPPSPVADSNGDAASWSRWQRDSLWPVPHDRGESKRGVRRCRCGSKERKRERKWGPAWARNAEKKSRGQRPVGRVAGGGGRW
jgi:hypothetical protein